MFIFFQNGLSPFPALLLDLLKIFFVLFGKLLFDSLFVVFFILLSSKIRPEQKNKKRKYETNAFKYVSYSNTG